MLDAVKIIDQGLLQVEESLFREILEQRGFSNDEIATFFLQIVRARILLYRRIEEIRHTLRLDCVDTMQLIENCAHSVDMANKPIEEQHADLKRRIANMLWQRGS